MSTDHTYEHRFDVTADEFWHMFFFDQEYNRGLYEHIRVKATVQKLDQQGAGPSLRVKRSQRLLADRDMPGVIKKLIGGSTEVLEEGEFDAAKGRFDMRISLPVIGSRVDYGGTYTWKDLPEGGFVRYWNVYCTARIPIVGKKAERFFMDEMDASTRATHEYSVRYLKEHR